VKVEERERTVECSVLEMLLPHVSSCLGRVNVAARNFNATSLSSKAPPALTHTRAPVATRAHDDAR
jgi:hypothetical protein